MEFMLSVTLMFFMWVGFMLVKLLLNEVERQRNPHLYSPKNLMARQRAAMRNRHRNASSKPNFEQFEKPRAAQSAPFEMSQIIHKRPSQNAQPAKSEPQICVNHQTQERLYTLVNGDMKVVRRLIDGVRERNPKRSNQWVWEKVIYDLERDRRI